MPICFLSRISTRAYAAQGGDFVLLTYVMGMEDMSAIADESLDFVTACHVIEHLRNPLRAFEQVYRKLKPGGHMCWWCRRCASCSIAAGR